jgi:hypothetical protein
VDEFLVGSASRLPDEHSVANKCLFASIKSEINAGPRPVNVSNLMRPAVNARGISQLLIPATGSYITGHNDSGSGPSSMNFDVDPGR